jgi:hypothetical protein
VGHPLREAALIRRHTADGVYMQPLRRRQGGELDDHSDIRGRDEPHTQAVTRSAVRAVCDKYDLPYTTGSFLLQYGKTWRTIAKLSLPNKYLRDTADNAPETRSERMFTQLEPGFARTDPATGRRRGLKTAISTVRQWRRGSATKRLALTT